MASVSSTSSATVSTSQTSSSVARSGLTADDVVTAKVQPLLDQIDTINDEISSNETKIAAYEDMQALLQNIANAVDALRNPSDQSTDVFNKRSATLTSSGSTAAADLMSVSVDAGTATGKHQVVVSQVATAERVSSDSQSSRSDALGLSGSFTIGEAGKTAVTIAVDSDDSLDDIVSAINKQTSTTGVTASVIAVSTDSSNPQYKLVLTASDTNQAIEMTTTDGSVLGDLGVTGSDGSTAANVLQAAQPAILTVDGISGIERDTNQIDDVIDGVTLDLTEADPDSTVTINIANNTSDVESAIEDLVTAYNSWREFVAENQKTNSDGTASSDATLFGDSTLRGLSLSVDSALNSFIGSTSLGSIGLTLNSDNELEVDSDALETALDSDFASVEALFEYQISTSSTDLTAISHNSSTYAGTITLDVTTDDDGNVTGVSGTDASGNAVDFTYSGNTIKGASGSLYAGMVFQWSGAASETVTITTTNGIASQLYALTSDAADTSTGSVQSVINNLQEQDDTMTARVASLQTRADNYATFLLDQYGKLEASISQANQTADILKQLMEYDTSGS
ncbi:MAG TPA: flagellar filament capping protein FliD [Dongiaceae bacterium]|nr:flagellar filament capping protein FliD [Dongiaceae bacterium]